MKFVLEQRTYSLYNNQEWIDFFQKIQDSSLSIETKQSILENRFSLNSINNYFYSSLLKRIDIYSLSNHSTMTINNFFEEQTNSIDYDNTYFYSEETSRLDDSSSFTTITSNFTKEFNQIQKDTSIYSDTDDISEGNNHISIYPHPNNNGKDEEILTSSNSNFLELIPAKISRIDQQTFSDYDLVNHSSEQNNTIRSSVDIVSLNLPMTSSISFTDKQLNKQEYKRTNQDDDEYYIIVDQQKSVDHLTMMNNENEIDDDEYIESTRLFDHGQHDGIHSDDSQYSDDIRYSSNTIQNSCISDDISNTSSTLRQEAISITKVRCKQRQTWINPSTNLLKPLISNNQVDGTNVISSCLNANMNSTTPTILSQKNSLDCNKNENKNGETLSYDFLQLNSDHRTMKTDETIVSPLLKANNTHDKDASSTSKKTNNFYLIHHQSSLIPINNLLNKNLNPNIEFIKMDDQNCILEIVDGVVTLVPKNRSSSSTNSDEEKSDEQKQNSIEYQTDSPKRERRLLSIASTISTPSISEHEQERDEISSSSSQLSSNKEQVQEPFVLLRDTPSKSPPLRSQTDQSVDLLDLFSTPPVPSSNSNTNNYDKNRKNLLDDSLSSVSSYENNNSNSESSEKEKVRSSSPIQNQSKLLSPSISIKDDLPSNKKSTLNDETEIDYQIPKTEPPPTAKPINKARINEFASLLSSAVHLTQPQINKKSETPKTIPPASPSRSEDQSYSSIPSASSDRDERESYHTVKSNTNSDFDQTKKHIDARYNEKIDDRKSIQINTSNIKALFEQKISDTNKALAQSSEHLLHLPEAKQHHKKAPVSYATLKHNLPTNPQPTNRRQQLEDSSNMNKYTAHVGGTKDVVIEDKQPEHGHQTQHYTRRNNTEQVVRPGADSLTNPSITISNGYYSESLIAREIRETKEKEEELRQQRKKCGLPEDVSTLLTVPNNNPIKPDASSKQPIKNSSFLSNLDFFTSKANESNSSRRSTIAIPNVVYDSHGTSSNDERKHSFSHESNRFNDNAIPIIRTSSTNNYIQRSSSNQNILSTQNTNNIIQREIEAIRAKEAELRQLGRIQHTSDEHSDPRKYQEFVSSLPKSQSNHALPTGKPKRDTERFNGPMTATSNGILKPKPMNNNLSIPSIRGKFPSPNPTAPIISSSNKSTDYSKLSSVDRLELEKRECQEREQELRKQRHSISGITLSVSSPMNGDSGNVSQDEHDDDQERYFDKIQRLKRTENEKAQAPLIRPTKKRDLSQKWEQMVASKNKDTTGDDDDDDVDKF